LVDSTRPPHDVSASRHAAALAAAGAPPTGSAPMLGMLLAASNGSRRGIRSAAMSIAKVIELSAASPESFEDAIRRGVERAGKTLDNIQSAWVHDQHVKVDGENIVEWRVIMKITFVLDEGDVDDED
jgi:dodecin